MRARAIAVAIAVAVAALAALAAGPTRAHAQSRGQAPPPRDGSADGDHVLVVSFSGQLPGALDGAPERLTRAMVDIIDEGTGLDRVDRAPLEDVLALAGCGDAGDECLQQALELLRVDRLLIGAVEPASGQVRVRLRVIAASRPARSRSFLVTGATAAALEQAFRAPAASFWHDPDAVDIDFTRPPAPLAAAAPPPAAAAPPVAGSLAAQEVDRAGFSATRVGRLGWTVAGGGAGLVLVGSALLLVAVDKQHQVDDAPTSTVEDLEALADLEASGRRHATWGTVLVAAGAAATCAGAVLIYKRGTGRRRDDARAARVGAQVTLSPAVFAGRGAGVILTVRGAP